MRGLGLAALVRGDLASTASALRVGQAAEVSRTFSSAEVASFSELTWDLNPLHLREGASGAKFGGRVLVQGLLCAGLFPALFAERLPGSVYASQALDFAKPVFVEDTVTARIQVSRLKTLRGTCLVHCDTLLSHADGSVAISGKARVVLHVLHVPQHLPQR